MHDDKPINKGIRYKLNNKIKQKFEKSNQFKISLP